MNEAEIANAEYWATFWANVEYWAFFAVVVALAVEFIGHKFGKPYEKALEHAREAALSKASLDIEDRKNENLRLSFNLEKARTELEMQKQKLAGRRPQFEKLPEISEKLRLIEPKVPLQIVSASQDEDTTGLAWELNALFGMSGWKTEPGTWSGGFVSGITIVGRYGGQHDDTHKTINAIETILKESSMGAIHFNTAVDVRQGTLRIVVGPKEVVVPESRFKEKTP